MPCEPSSAQPTIAGRPTSTSFSRTDWAAGPRYFALYLSSQMASEALVTSIRSGRGQKKARLELSAPDAMARGEEQLAASGGPHAEQQG